MQKCKNFMRCVSKPNNHLTYSIIFDSIIKIDICGCGEIGRRAGLRILWATVGVQVPSSAPKNAKKDPDSCVY